MGGHRRRRKPKPEELFSEAAREPGEIVAGTSLEYDLKAGKIKATPVYFVEEPVTRPVSNWKLHLALFILGLVVGIMLAFNAKAWGGEPQAPPKIGKLTLPAPWWEIVKDACRQEGLKDPCWPVAVMAIESRFYRLAFNKAHKCYGLMQLQKDVYRKMNVDNPFDADQNIRAGVKILARLERKYGGNKTAILKKYNPTDTGAYSREVLKAWKQARRNHDLR